MKFDKPEQMPKLAGGMAANADLTQAGEISRADR